MIFFTIHPWSHVTDNPHGGIRIPSHLCIIWMFYVNRICIYIYMSIRGLREMQEIQTFRSNIHVTCKTYQISIYRDRKQN